MDLSNNIPGFYFSENEIKEKRLHFLFDNLNVGVMLINRDIKIEYVNRKMNKFLKINYGQNFIIGESLFNYIINKENKELFKKYIDNVLIGKEIKYIWELSISGKIRWFEINLYPFKNELEKIDEIIMQVTDITKSKETERKIFESEARYKAIVDSQTELICRFKTDGTIVFVNKAYCDYFAQDFEIMQRINFFDLIPEEIRLKAVRDIQKLSNEKPHNHYIQRVENSKGDIKCISGTNTAIFDSEGNITEIQSVGNDVTKLKIIEQNLLKTNNRLNTILRASHDNIMILNKEGIILDLYLSGPNQINFTGEVIPGKNIRSIIPGELTKIFEEKIKLCFSKSEEVIFDYRLNINNELKYYESILIKYDVNEAVLILRDITDKRKSENTIIQSEELYHKLIDTAPYAVVIIDHFGKIIYYSAQFNNIINNDIKNNILGEEFDYWIYNKDKNRFKNFINSVKDIDKSISDQFKICNENHDYIIVEINICLIKTRINGSWGHVLIIKDFTKEVFAEKNLKLFNNVVEHCPVSILITDFNGIIEYINNYFTELSGYSADDIIGKTPEILNSEITGNDNYKELWESIKRGKEWKGEMINKNKKGNIYTENVTISPIKSANGKIENFLWIKENITAHKIVLEELEKAKLKAEESNRLKSTFLSNISHEIRTPLNGILGFASLLQSSVNENYTSRLYAEIINKCGNQLLIILNDILELSIIESNQIELRPSEVSVSEIINNLTDYLENYLFEKNKKSIKVIKYFPKAGINSIYVDASRLNQLLINVLINAAKFTDKGRIEFGYTIRRSNVIRFFVKDTGIGIAQDNFSVIFEPFRQVAESLNRESGGNGLGLAITRVLVERMRGKIYLKSVPGKGSTFYIELPVQKIKQIKSIPLELPNDNITYKWPNKKILIIEDNYSNYMLLKAILRKTEVSMLIAQTGKEGLKFVEEHPDIDIILLDIMLPDFDGHDIARIIKKDQPGIPIIALTAYTNSSGRNQALEAGIDEYLSKPFLREELMKIINVFINKDSNK